MHGNTAGDENESSVTAMFAQDVVVITRSYRVDVIFPIAPAVAGMVVF